jgi:succinylarginine dihydrolase
VLREINFDGIVGPSHNYAGLSLGNLASQRNAGTVSAPRDAALQGIAKMRVSLDLGQVQGILLPHDRPNRHWLAQMGTNIEGAEGALRAIAMSASAMWAANAATVSPAPDTADGRCHLTVANLLTMPHRSHEWPETLRQMRLAFADRERFAVHPPIPAPFGDEGAANHMRLSAAHDAAGIEVFVFGRSGGPFPARQHREASAAVARLHGLDPGRVILAEQSPEAIAAGAFHNDVVAVANEHVLFVHAQAFVDQNAFYETLRRRLPQLEIIEAPANKVSLADAVQTYLFNAQLVTLREGGMALILPADAARIPHIWSWLNDLVTGAGPIRRLETVDIRQSMANGGGPACLRLRVVADPAYVDPRFLVDHARLDGIEAVVRLHWPERIAADGLDEPDLCDRLRAARLALLAALDLAELE